MLCFKNTSFTTTRFTIAFFCGGGIGDCTRTGSMLCISGVCVSENNIHKHDDEKRSGTAENCTWSIWVPWCLHCNYSQNALLTRHGQTKSLQALLVFNLVSTILGNQGSLKAHPSTYIYIYILPESRYVASCRVELSRLSRQPLVKGERLIRSEETVRDHIRIGGPFGNTFGCR